MHKPKNNVTPSTYIDEYEDYRAGVERATIRESAREARITTSLAALVGFGNASDVDAAKAATERSDARKAKYPPTETWVRFLPVPRGSRPLKREEIEAAMRNAEPLEAISEVNDDDRQDHAGAR